MSKKRPKFNYIKIDNFFTANKNKKTIKRNNDKLQTQKNIYNIKDRPKTHITNR